MQQAVNTPIVNLKAKDNRGTEMLLGHCSRSCLYESPYKEWFEKNYADYSLDSATANKLEPLLKRKTVVVFLGTWCGDSRRETPRLVKILDYCRVPDEQLKLIMTDYQEGAYKQSPQHEEKGKQIFRVPTVIVYSGNKEIGRIVESPRQSLEKDLLQILSSAEYKPNYSAGNWLLKKMEHTAVKKLYRDSASIREKIKPELRNNSELNSIGYVLIDRKDLEKAIFTFQINARLYPNSITAYNGLASAYIQNRDEQKAKQALEKARIIDANNEETKRLFKLLE